MAGSHLHRDGGTEPQRAGGGAEYSGWAVAHGAGAGDRFGDPGNERGGV